MTRTEEGRHETDAQRRTVEYLVEALGVERVVAMAHVAADLVERKRARRAELLAHTEALAAQAEEARQAWNRADRGRHEAVERFGRGEISIKELTEAFAAARVAHETYVELQCAADEARG